MSEESYEALARKYRPQTFADVAGQGMVSQTLKNAVRQGRSSHAYLLAGPRGCGKTSLARILAKALNCVRPNEGEPCNECSSCHAVQEGNHFDVDEFDAASNRKVEDAEALLARVPAQPMREDTHYKVFIVDEVHMMTGHAFNAMLKTLEEPPSWVKFVFCTTEPEALPDTILSRCQRFDLRPIPRDAMVERLRLVCDREGIEADEVILRALVRRARGGMRDALQLLDQAVSLCGKKLDPKQLYQAFGMSSRGVAVRILEAVAEGSFGKVLESVEAAYREGWSAEVIAEKTLEVGRDLMVVAALGEKGGGEILDSQEMAADLLPLASRLGPERLLHILAHGAELERRLAQAKNDRVLVELTFLKLARLGDLIPLGEALEKLTIIEETAKRKNGQDKIPTASAR